MSTTGNPKTNRAGIRLPANRSFERELAQLEAMSDHTPQGEDIERLRKSLGHENNYLVSKAARIVADNALMELLPDSLTAFNRFFKDPVKDDPQCWAKTSLAKALVKLQCRDVSVFLRGLNHRQEEPVWGGLSDTAGTLRATCALALAACDGLDDARLFDLLLTPFVDSDKTVRVEAARAIGHIGGVTAALLLKMRILLRKEEPEVLGACFSALLGLEGGDREGSIALVAEFLYEGEEAASEAAFALAETHNPIALKPLIVRRRGSRRLPFFDLGSSHCPFAPARGHGLPAPDD